jgi:DNA topoisomerase I
MSKKLFIVESPNKVSTAKKYLGADYQVAASVGHTYQLPKKNYVDIKNGFKLLYEPDPKKRDALKTIEKLAEKCDEIYLATDADTEGSCIAWHLYEHLLKKNKKKPFIRVNLKEITKTGIQQALAASYPITDPKEFSIVQAGFLRRIEDRFVGFQVSPLAYVHVQSGTSAGRVQSPALRIVVEREREIQSFVPEVYYEIFAELFPTGTTETFKAKYAKEIKDEKTANLIVSQTKGKPATITKIDKKQTKSTPAAPFITKTLLASASTVLGWKTEKATIVAQQLFQNGHITYIRTDNTIISDDGQKMLTDYVKQNFAPSYVPKTLPNYNNDKAKLEHECIRPTDLSANPILPADDAKLYDLIRRRFIAAGMTPAVYDSVSVDISIGSHPFKVSGSTLNFDGWTQVWHFNKKSDSTLPEMNQDTSLSQRDLYSEKKQTKPPSRYKGASLIEALDKMGIGKPSTINSILKILEERQYIKYEQQIIVPTDLGMRLNDFLMKYFLKIIDFDFTKRVEEEQDEVMLGKLKYEDAVGDFYKSLKEEIKQATIKINESKEKNEATTITCPKCKDNFLAKKLNKKTGTFFYSCTGYQDKTCMATYAIDENNQPVENKVVQEILSDCPRKGCGGVLIKRLNKSTKEVFYACSNWQKENGGCKVSADASGAIKEPKKVKKLGTCPKCKKGEMVERVSRQGVKFAGCNRFPACKTTQKIEEPEKA